MDRFETFAGSILELSRYIQRLKDLEMKAFGLRANHVMCLYYLGKNPGGLTVTKLAEVCKEDKAAVSRCVAQLVEQGYVGGNFPENKRSYRTLLTLTPSGMELSQKIYERVAAALNGGGLGLTEEQRENFYAVLQIIMDNLARYTADREK